ncbi:MAG TPA: hypothetical protein PKG54_10125 [Phycisphaerae bacterium]|jgi:hypothetical protein|nr:hypothetical protein [Phycisphaerae bacterium]HOB74872.1 hypothetical protein [Phycisphaerae bacterium]HOJ53734.1 hypothetical protein [Phycisphaerae bacterium]HOL27958.1 hypothetical protein [Phycisphaerae bacterium]HPP22206.1 hypothetical protein [Phycisphaerae bacterium]
MGDLELPAEIISAQLHRMETAPAVCVGMVLCAIPLLILIVFTMAMERGFDSGVFVCMGVPMVVAMMIWAISMERFRASCLGKPGWSDALRRYHLYGLGLSALVAGLLLSPWFLHELEILGRLPAERILRPVITGLSFAGVAVVIGLIGPRVHRRLKEILTPLQREVAVTLARDVLRRKLRSSRRW